MGFPGLDDLGGGGAGDRRIAARWCGDCGRASRRPLRRRHASARLTPRACVTIASRLDGFWRLSTALTAAAGLALTVATALAYQRDAASTGLVQRSLIVVYWAWIIVLGLELAKGSPVP